MTKDLPRCEQTQYFDTMIFNLRYTYGGQIDPQGYKFIYNFVKCGDNKISFGDFS